MNFVDLIVTVVLLTPIIYSALWYRNRVRLESGIADQIVRHLCDRSRLAAKPVRQIHTANPEVHSRLHENPPFGELTVRPKVSVSWLRQR